MTVSDNPSPPSLDEMINAIQADLRDWEDTGDGSPDAYKERHVACLRAALAHLEASRWRPIETTLTRDDLLTLLIEECAEVIHATTKCQRFGFSSNHIAEYGRNDIKLSSEVGDLAGIFAALHQYLDAATVSGSKRTKIARAEAAKRDYASPPAITSEGEIDGR